MSPPSRLGPRLDATASPWRARAAAAITIVTVLGSAGAAGAPRRPAPPARTSMLTSEETAALLGATDFFPIEFATYDGRNQVTHPSAVEFAAPWHGHRFWLALTPYPYSDAQYENPSVYAGDTGSDWAVPPEVSNPVVQTTRGYLSDPNLVYDPDADALRLYYREVANGEDSNHLKLHLADNVLMTRSTDGTHWSAPQTLVSDRGGFFVSPAVVRTGPGDWRMWQVTTDTAGCNAKRTQVVERRSADGLAWSPSMPVDLVQPGYSAWHLSVQYVAARGEYWALVAAFPRGRDCTMTSLFLATSADGVTWTTYPSPVLARGVAARFNANVYESSFIVDATGEEMTIWLTGAEMVAPRSPKSDAILEWSAALMRTKTRTLLTRLATQTDNPVPADAPLDGFWKMRGANLIP